MKTVARVLATLVVLTLVAGIGVVAWWLLYGDRNAPLPLQDHCVARVADLDVALSTEQTRNASIIVGVATQRGLAPRASTIALATVYQESGIRNLDYGDRDSLGLFQQRPSQGWGTPEQVQEPYYASGTFYDALVKVKGWDTGDVNDVAQTVQRSGHPNGYAKHVENARRLASSLTGETPASFSCMVRRPPPGDPAALVAFLSDTLPSGTRITNGGDHVRIVSPTSRGAWSAAHLSVGQVAAYGVSSVEVGSRTWTHTPGSISWWQGADSTSTEVLVWFDLESSPRPTP